jgi:hypothetical protein
MPSPAAHAYIRGVKRAHTLREVTTDVRLRPLPREDAQTFAHAYLTSLVAVWDAYLKELARAFYQETAMPLRVDYHAMHEVVRMAGERAIERFNTPNWENARNFLIATTGYDPISDWTWPRRGMGVQDVKERLNQILRVRHSFAHGFAIPSYSWTTSKSGRVRLTVEVLRDTEAFFNNLVRKTDSGLQRHIETTYGRAVAW